MLKMNLNNFFDTGRKKAMFKATVKEGAKTLKFFVNAYDKEEAESEAKKKMMKEHPGMNCEKISIEEVRKR